MAEKKYRYITAADDSCSTSSDRKGTSLITVPCVKNRDELKKFEETEDCLILDFDPDDDLNFSNLSISENDADVDFSLLAEKGEVALRDFPHSRHSCAKLPFEKTVHDNHCEVCYCYVCDLPAPCQKWVGAPSHCHAFDDEKWNALRELYRQLHKLQKKIECEEFQFENTTPSENKLPIPGSSTSTFRISSASSIESQEQRLQHNLNPSESGGEGRSYQRSEGATLYVGNLPDYFTNIQLRELFSIVGVVRMCRILNRYGFVTMRSVEEAEKAVRLLNGFELVGRLLTVKKSTPRRADTYKIYVSNLSWAVDDECLERVFTEHGFKILSARVIVDWDTGKSRQYGYVEVSSEAERFSAIMKLRGYVLDGMEMGVMISFR